MLPVLTSRDEAHYGKFRTSVVTDPVVGLTISVISTTLVVEVEISGLTGDLKLRRIASPITANSSPNKTIFFISLLFSSCLPPHLVIDHRVGGRMPEDSSQADVQPKKQKSDCDGDDLHTIHDDRRNRIRQKNTLAHLDLLHAQSFVLSPLKSTHHPAQAEQSPTFRLGPLCGFQGMN